MLRMKKNWTLRELLDSLKKAYCGKIGVEYMHIPYNSEQLFLKDKIENRQFERIPSDQKMKQYRRLLWAHEFGTFLATRFNTQKRFGLEGCTTFIPGLKFCIDKLREHGAEHALIGMPHRGRLNVLANVVRKPMEQIFAEFHGTIPTKDEQDGTFSGDVKYHLGTSFKKHYEEDGKDMRIEILANPSHLEAVNPVVLGKVRALQHILHDSERKKVVPILVHGDASFAGQGVVYECMQMMDLPDYKVGGTIHIIVNNQIGFTTNPAKSRSGIYSSDLAKALDCPVFHVNADSLDDVVQAFEYAAEYRQEYKNDVVIDLIGYRRFGHNELDQPMFTQPLMYKQISSHPRSLDIYEKQLLDEGIMTKEDFDEQKKIVLDFMEEAYKKSKDHKFSPEDWQSPEWQNIRDPENKYTAKIKDTGVPTKYLKEIGQKISQIPDHIKSHPEVAKVYSDQAKAISSGKNIDIRSAEALAFATLIDEGFHVRISGQDVERGTLSHRHSFIHDQHSDKVYCPISTIKKDQRAFIASNSPLSEFSVVGFEYGYAQASPNTLTIWEAQTGDFNNVAQVIIDQFIASGENKWNVKNGLVMLLPHGLDGNGPEHSSCRVERFLSLCDGDDEYQDKLRPSEVMQRSNMQVVNCSTSAQYFHVMRRQMHRTFRKPLIVLAPKKLLYSKDPNSDIEEFDAGLRFKRVISNENPNSVAYDKVRKLVFCSGQVYYDLVKAREETKSNDVAIVRIEQLHPMPFQSVEAEMKKYKNAQVTWCQEEHKNQGAYYYLEPRLRSTMRHVGSKQDEVDYVGRAPSASTSAGLFITHKKELEAFLKDAMN